MFPKNKQNKVRQAKNDQTKRRNLFKLYNHNKICFLFLCLFIFYFFLFMFFITSHLQHKLEVSVQMGFWTKEKSNLLKKKKKKNYFSSDKLAKIHKRIFVLFSLPNLFLVCLFMPVC